MTAGRFLEQAFRRQDVISPGATLPGEGGPDRLAGSGAPPEGGPPRSARRPSAWLAAPRRWWRLASLVVASSLLAACAASRPEPPPYPTIQPGNPLPLQWRYGSVGRALTGFVPAVVGEEIWAASESGRITVLDLQSGRYKRTIDVGTRLAAGIGSDGELQVVVTRDGEVLAYDGDGQRRWRAPIEAEVTTPPAVAGLSVAVRAVDGRILLLEAADGTIRWTWRQQPLPALTLRQSAPMVFHDDVLYAGLPGARIVALDLRLGAPRWEQQIATARGATELERLIDVASEPVIHDGRVCAIAYQGRLACLSESDGRVTWSRDVSSGSGLAIGDGLVVTIDGSDRVLGFRYEGDELWRQDGYAWRAMTRPTVVGDYVAFGDRFGSINVLAARDGQPLARHSPDGKAITAGALVVRHVAYYQTVGGSLVALPLR